jgi:hypothetical protein
LSVFFLDPFIEELLKTMSSTEVKTPVPLATKPIINFPSTVSKKDPVRKMKALEWHGRKDVRVVRVQAPSDGF